MYQSEVNNIFKGVRLLDLAPEFEAKIEKEIMVSRVGEELKSIRFIKGVDKEWSGTAPRGLEFWKLLSTLYQEGPVREQDKL